MSDLDEFAKSLSNRMDEEILRRLHVGPAIASARASDSTLTAGSLEQRMKEWDALLQDYKRNNVTLVVSALWSLPIMKMTTTEAGSFFYCRPEDAAKINEKVPLMRVRVVSRDTAHFEIATAFHKPFIPFSAPPYIVEATP